MTMVEDKDSIKRIPAIEKLNIDRVLSFNYSDTYEKWYGTNKTGIEYDYIHGKAGVGNDMDTCNLVLGIEEYLEEPSKTFDNEFIEFKKFYQRIFKRTGSRYLSWIGNINAYNEKTKNANPPRTNVFFMGIH